MLVHRIKRQDSGWSFEREEKEALSTLEKEGHTKNDEKKHSRAVGNNGRER